MIIRLLIAPGEPHIAKAATRRMFPFGLARQTPTQAA